MVGPLGLLLALCVILPARATAQGDEPEARYRHAQKAYEQGRYSSVIEILRPVLYPTNLLSDSDHLISAYKMLGVSYVFEHQLSNAEESFYAILALDPAHTLDPLIDPPAAVSVFERVKQRNAERLRRVAERQRQERERHRSERRDEQKIGPPQPIVERFIERRSYWVNFVPFGAGQFQNGQRTKGLVLLTTQAALAAVSLGSALTLRLAFPDSRPDRGELSTARGLNATMVASGALFWGAVLYGVIDALMHYEPAVVIDKSHGARTRRTALVPSAGPHGAGLSVKLTF